MTSRPPWSAPTPDVLDSPDDSDGLPEVPRLAQRGAAMRPPMGEPLADVVQSPETAEAIGYGGPIRAGTSSDATGDGGPVSSGEEAAERRRRVDVEYEAAADAEAMAAASAATQRLLEDNKTLARTADLANGRCRDLEALVDAERSRHAVNDMRVGDVEMQLERLTRRLHATEEALATRDAELRSQDAKLADVTQLRATEAAAQRAAVEHEAHRAARAEDQVKAQRDVIDNLDCELASAVKSRNDAQRLLARQTEAAESALLV